MAIVAACTVAIAVLGGTEAFIPATPFGGARQNSPGCRQHTVGMSASRGTVEPSGAAIGSGALRTNRRNCEHQRHETVGVLRAQMTDEEMAIDQALVARVAREVEQETGVDLEQLINPAKVINLERDLAKLRTALEAGTGSRREIEQEISKKESTLSVEKRSYMQGWLKKVFVGQAVITTVLGGLMAYDAVPFFHDVDISVRVLGFWFVWLFTVPSLRARKPGASEKVALNIAFLATPLVSFAMPFITKDPVPIYWANIAVLAACYGYGFTVGKPEGENGSDKNQPKWLKFIYKSLDFGSGQERGARARGDDPHDSE